MCATAGNAARHLTLVDQVVENVYERIIRGRLKPGQRITEDSLARDFGVSRTPVREAVKCLVEMGVIVAHRWTRLEVAAADAEDIRQINELRADLECLALNCALPRLDQAAMAELETLADRCRRLAQHAGKVEVFRADSGFHLAIARLGGNRHLLDVLTRLDVKVQLCRAFSCISIEKIRHSAAFHRLILEAMQAGDLALAKERMRLHIQGTTDGPRDVLRTGRRAPTARHRRRLPRCGGLPRILNMED